MLPRILQLLCVLVLAGVFLAFAGGRAEAEEALASWYGPGFEGQPTASGEIYDPSGYTAASKTLPLGTELVVNYNGYSVPVTVNDRGPYVGSRSLNLSQGAAEQIGLTQAGVDYVDYVVGGSTQTASTPVSSTETAYTADTTQPTSTQTYTATQDSSASGGGGAYVVQSGDNLTSIAAQLGTSVDYLASSNGIANPDYTLAGQTIYY
ncbi:MAG: septal ring lytic transglycosylase RlpA family protein [Rubrobacteraceae bacterium]